MDMAYLTRKKVLFVSGSKLPIPSKIGAIETIMSDFLKMAQKNGSPLDYRVLSQRPASDPHDTTIYRYYQQSWLSRFSLLFYKLFAKIIAVFFGKQLLPPIDKNCLKVLKRFVQEEQIDVIVLLNYGNYGMKIRKFYRGNLFVYLHNNYLHKDVCQLENILEKLDGVIAVSKFLLAQIPEELHSKVGFLTVLRNGIDTQRFQPVSPFEKRSLRKKWGVSPNKKIILYVGRLHPSKGIQLLIQSLKRRGIDHCQLVIVGQSSFSNNRASAFEKKMMNEIKELSIDSYFFSDITHENIHEFYQLSDICVVPSLVAEACCLVALEARACGVRTIATDVGAISEYGENQVTLIPTNHHLLSVLATTIEAAVSGSMPKPNRECQFTLTKHYEELTNFFQFVLGNQALNK